MKFEDSDGWLDGDAGSPRWGVRPGLSWVRLLAERSVFFDLLGSFGEKLPRIKARTERKFLRILPRLGSVCSEKMSCEYSFGPWSLCVAIVRVQRVWLRSFSIRPIVYPQWREPAPTRA